MNKKFSFCFMLQVSMVSCYRVMHTGELGFSYIGVRQASGKAQIQLEIGISRFLGQAEKYKNQINLGFEVLSITFFFR